MAGTVLSFHHACLQQTKWFLFRALYHIENYNIYFCGFILTSEIHIPVITSDLFFWCLALKISSVQPYSISPSV